MEAFRTETIEHKGRRFLVSMHFDDDSSPPWEREDGHGPVRYCEDGEPLQRGETVLYDLPRGRYVYNFGAALVQAFREGWGLCPEDVQALAARLGKKPTKGQIRAEAVRKDMAYVRGWAADHWFYMGVCVQILGPDDEPEDDEFAQAVWGVESCGDHWQEIAASLAGQILHERGAAWRAALREAREIRAWAARDVQTVGA